MSQTIVAQIQSRIKTRRCAVNLVMLMKLFGQQKLQNFFPEASAVRSSYFLAGLKKVTVSD